ncbi:MAG: hypothetical protein LBB48_07775 [Treponema sp.]|jgi:hypothetical protein|nr:hypothetical protein [Treponema sp.]
MQDVLKDLSATYRYTVIGLSPSFGSLEGITPIMPDPFSIDCLQKSSPQTLPTSEEVEVKHQSRYGGPQVGEEPRWDSGKLVILKEVVRLMRKIGLNARRRSKFIPTTNSSHGSAVWENVLNWRFCAGKPVEKRVPGITYPHTSGNRVYLTMILDLFDRRVIDRDLSDDIETVLTAIPAAQIAFTYRQSRDTLLFHSDKGNAVLREILSRAAEGNHIHR